MTISLKLQLRNHPAQRRHPFTDAPLFDDSNVPVPLFPDQRALYLWSDGNGTPDNPPRWVHIAYCGGLPGMPLSLLYHEKDNDIRDAYVTFVTKEVGAPSNFSQPVSAEQIAKLEKIADDLDDETDTEFDDEEEDD